MIFSVFRRRKNKRKRNIFPLSVLFITFRQGLPKAMHLALDGKGVSVYTLSSKQISLALSFSKAKDRKGSICFFPLPKKSLLCKSFSGALQSDKRLVCLRHFLDYFRADRTHDFAVRYTGEVICKNILEPVFFVSRFAEYILV